MRWYLVVVGVVAVLLMGAAQQMVVQQIGDDWTVQRQRAIAKWHCRKQDADGILKTGPGAVGAVILTAAVTDTLVLYDGLSASGTPIILDVESTTIGVAGPVRIPLDGDFDTGLFLDISAGVEATVCWL